ncbi:MAG TPA: hypothetical protein ENL27_02040 [Candidatus Parcubacteria bacterium]|nr:hypothetical protein [Candidatus Parcubacteria bacterium]
MIFEKEIEKKTKRRIIPIKEIYFRNNILAYSFQYFEKYGVFDAVDFKKDVVKTAVSKAVDEAYRNFLFFSKKNKKIDINDFQVLLTFSPNILKARVGSINFPRGENADLVISEEEEDMIYQKAFSEFRKKNYLEVEDKYKILPPEIEWTRLELIQNKIDGYIVPGLRGYKGRQIEIKILGVFLLRDYSQKIKSAIKELGLDILKIVHLSEVLLSWPLFKGKRGVNVFVDVGGEASQIFLTKSGRLEAVGELNLGGSFFSRQIMEDLGIDEESARFLKEQYSQKILRGGSSEKIKSILLSARKEWRRSFENALKGLNIPSFLPLSSGEDLPRLPIFLFGGGSMLPETAGSLKEEVEGYNFLFDVNLIKPVDLISKDELNGNYLDDSQLVPALILTNFNDNKRRTL